jgi:Right handed beta helix region
VDLKHPQISLSRQYFIMKKTVNFFALLLFPFSFVSAATYYIDSVRGNDGANGASSSSAWETLGKLKGRSFQPGDKVLLKRGSVWHESLPISSPGPSGNPITYDAYGVGNKPEVTGGVRLTGWTAHPQYGWQTKTDASVNTLFINGVRQAKARWPNKGTNKVSAKPPNCTQISSNSITQPSGYWNGATIWIENANWNVTSKSITKHTGNTVYWGGDLPRWCRQTVGSDFWIEGKLQELDADGEWYKSGSTVYLKWPTNPNNSVVIGTGGGDAIRASNKDNITIRNIRFSYFDNNGAMIENSVNWTFDSVEFLGIDGHGLTTGLRKDGVSTGSGGANNLTVKDSTFSHVLSSGIVILGGNNVNILNNTLTDICGDPKRNIRRGEGIYFRTGNTRIAGNTLSRLCYDGIWVGENLTNVVIENNDISHYVLAMNDGGGIYFSYGGDGVVARNNYTHDAGPTSNSVGIYPDMNVTGTTIENNLIINGGAYGILCNRCRHNIFRYNTIVDTVDRKTSVNIRLSEGSSAGKTVDNQIYGNILVNTGKGDANAWAIEDVQADNSKRGMSRLDYNLYYMPNQSQPICFRPGGYHCTYAASHSSIETYSVSQLQASSWNFENNGIQANPAFVNQNGGNFALSQEAPAKDKGDWSSFPSVDAIGTTRPQGSGPDIGACEGDGDGKVCGAANFTDSGSTEEGLPATRGLRLQVVE